MYAVIETGGKQFKVEQGDEIYAELLNAEADDVVELKVVALGGEEAQILQRAWLMIKPVCYHMRVM